MSSIEALKKSIEELKNELSVTIVAHYYQKDEVYEIADITGDSLELAKRAKESDSEWVLFCGVGFMGQSVKILAPQKRVAMPKIACCAMARMIDSTYFDESVAAMVEAGIPKEDILPITYINSGAEVKAKVGQMGGAVCTSSSAVSIIQKAMESKKKILFVPDRCLGQNVARKMGLKSAVIGIDKPQEIAQADIICYNGFCSVHQLFTLKDVEFFRKKYPGIKIAVHPECDPSVCEVADFVGSTSQIIKYVQSLPLEQKVAVGTEYNLVHRLRSKNTYVLSSTKPECPTMNETTLEDVYNTLLEIQKGNPINEIHVDEETIHWAKVALERMFAYLEA
ncbi:quinolinate synthase NadA [Nitratiruptor tergarcus]|uniref:Quinolinate synthase n=1 Tax=Nitratiruptor tergarcus DSM 16512 TaxID=1069081 RepID=A0A1W1WRZ8_9BACT|nr:quinolinate synthase NadA [Nitratiruptor tergarcus]SMC09091.1 quinolinate synthetase [Nitratiruptor tergarcus DSM 16512]